MVYRILADKRSTLWQPGQVQKLRFHKWSGEDKPTKEKPRISVFLDPDSAMFEAKYI